MQLLYQAIILSLVFRNTKVLFEKEEDTNFRRGHLVSQLSKHFTQFSR